MDFSDRSESSDDDNGETAMQALEIVKEQQRQHPNNNDDTNNRKSNAGNHHRNPQEPCDSGARQTFYDNVTSKTAVDTLLFRLIVALELLEVRIDDAHFVMVGRRMAKQQQNQEHHHQQQQHQVLVLHEESIETSTRHFSNLLLVLGLAAGAGFVTMRNKEGRMPTAAPTMLLAAKSTGAAALAWLSWKGASKYWMADKIIRSADALKDWASQWELIHSRRRRNQPMYQQRTTVRTTTSQTAANNNNNMSMEELLGIDEKSRQLIEHAMKHGRKTYFWRSTGEIRFLMLKRFMDVYYASVGTAINNKQTSSLALPLVTAAASSFYSMTGVSQQALSDVVNESSRDLLKHAW
ncbi:MAG: hypothetical protein SGARI_000444 [Bacillariaceae sp.]